MCGIWFLTTRNDFSLSDLLNSAKAIEHRGQDGFGSYISYDGGDYFRIERKPAELSFPKAKNVDTMIVNFRYATVGKDDLVNFPPATYIGKRNITKNNVSGNNMLLGFLNGEFSVGSFREELLNNGFVLRATNDTAVVSGLVQQELLDNHDLMESVMSVLSRVSGSYCIVFTRNNESIIARDVFGTRNGCLYLSDHLNTICVASEPQCFYPLDPFYSDKLMASHPYSSGWRSMFPGEVIRVKNHEVVECNLMKQEDLSW